MVTHVANTSTTHFWFPQSDRGEEFVLLLSVCSIRNTLLHLASSVLNLSISDEQKYLSVNILSTMVGKLHET